MKKKIMGAVFAVSMLTAAPVLAADTPAPAETTENAGWVSTVTTTISNLHKGKAAYVSGTVALAVVALIAYNWGKADAEETTTKDGELL